MAALNWSSLGTLRCPVWLRGPFVWFLLVLLITGAASYTHGSRYAVVPDYGGQVQAADQQGIQDVRPQAESAASPPDTSISATQATRTVYRAAPPPGTEEVERDCCQRRLAPRGEPAPMRISALDPQSLIHNQPGGALLSASAPPAPDLPALTVVKLSISRT